MCRMVRSWVIGLVWFGLVVVVQAADVRQEIRFPDLPGYQTLVCDFHMHTVFSDANVWPPIRVKEAWRQGFHVIAISDHIEYQPHKEDIPTKHNRPYELMVGEALSRNILLIQGAEITRDTPPGHFNAIFLKDVTPLDHPELLEVIRRAHEQGAFVFWNHPGWQGPERGKWGEVQTTIYQNKWLQGIEVCNGDSYYPEAHQWALEKNLTMLGNSDIHDPDLREKSSPADHRTTTLVLVKERTADAVKEALQARRTIVWYKDQLIGREEWLRPMFQAGVQVCPPHLRPKNAILFHIRNTSEVDVRLQRTDGPGPAELVLPAGTVTLVRVGTPDSNKPLQLQYTVTNFLIAPQKGLPVTLDIPGPQE